MLAGFADVESRRQTPSLCIAYARQSRTLAVHGGRRRQRTGQAVGFQRHHRALALSAGWPSRHAGDSKRHQGSRRDSGRCGDRRRFGRSAARSSELRFWNTEICAGSRRPICSSTNMTGAQAAKGSSALPLPATATTIGGPRNCMPSPKTARARASFTRRPMLANSLPCRRYRATDPGSRSSRAS